MSELCIFSWLWSQPQCRTTYDANTVNVWAAMVRRHLTIPHRLACVTDIPAGIDPSIEIITPPGCFEKVRIPTWGPRRPQCLRRLAMFRPDAANIFGERFVSMDLDCVIGGNLDSLFDHDDDFRMFKGTGVKRPYNGSLIQMTAGARPKVYTEFTEERAAEAGREFVGSDQAWISYILGWGERTWDEADGVTWYQTSQCRQMPTCRLMFFPGPLKPWMLAGPMPQDRWITEHYRADVKEAA